MQTERDAAMYLAAMIDGEGHVNVTHPKVAYIANTDWDLIEATVECCLTLGLHYRIQSAGAQRPGHMHCWRVTITGQQSFERIRDLVPLRSRRKAARIADLAASYTKRTIVRPEREWLEQKYVIEGLSLQQIADLVGARAGRSVSRWMDQYGIPRRDREVARLAAITKEKHDG